MAGVYRLVTPVLLLLGFAETGERVLRLSKMNSFSYTLGSWEFEYLKEALTTAAKESDSEFTFEVIPFFMFSLMMKEGEINDDIIRIGYLPFIDISVLIAASWERSNLTVAI